ncbi:PhzF family phenazine biosynthesis protein [Oleiagrimonas sp. C23AA]|uniref:PhzF family phenazine biosynthesis protein n=1 Tax=Oleiagrimonas sp. C23AA TaxID=2719047 RepID=UPI00142125D7|nr:PhzF family phenazine biosynthesis protein [Oleiagrimonas sp. C23AA]NII10011.1 PhzF family phenazine biosynthesis protein [Oleiagrimonas sp. C23AA]
MTPRRYLEVDVFTTRALAGNPLGVIVDAEGLDAATMQRIATWTNLSETTFLLPPTQPGADYRVRIFTPRQELPFAGHPSVGSAYAAITCGLVDVGKSALVQECAAGLLPVSVDGTDATRRIRVQAPRASFDGVDRHDIEALHKALGATSRGTPLAVCNGPVWITLDLEQAGTVRGLVPDMGAIAELCLALDAVGVCVFGADEGDAAMAVRAFCPADGIPEDPVTGSANAAIAAYLQHVGELDRYGRQYRASQGREVGRDGYVDVAVDATGHVSIGGDCVIVVEGKIRI